MKCQLSLQIHSIQKPRKPCSPPCVTPRLAWAVVFKAGVPGSTALASPGKCKFPGPTPDLLTQENTGSGALPAMFEPGLQEVPVLSSWRASAWGVQCRFAHKGDNALVWPIPALWAYKSLFPTAELTHTFLASPAPWSVRNSWSSGSWAGLDFHAGR